MIYNEIWAVPVYRIEEFFQKENNMTSKNSVHGTAYFFKNCQITLEELPANEMLKIPRTKVVMQGDDKDTKEIHEKFFLNFLSAGG